ncbi:ATP-binding protein [bacterium]|nr:ATP-binding protein [bacterium]
MEVVKSYQPVGYIVGNVETQRFRFVTEPSICPPRLEYLVVRDVPATEQGMDKVDVLAQVSELRVATQVLGEELTFEEAKAILEGLSPRPKIIGTADVLGYLTKDKSVRLPRHTPLPGQPVFLASDEFLKKFFSENIEYGITIGTLINREGVEVKLNPNGLRRHLAIIAQTGAGKSYLAGLLLEQLLKLGATILVFDPNSDYVMMRLTKDMRKTSFADWVRVYRVPLKGERRYSDEKIGGSRKYTIRFWTLDEEDIFEIAQIHESWTRIRESLSKLLSFVKKRSTYFTPKELKETLDEFLKGESAGELDELEEGIGEEFLEAITQDMQMKSKDRKNTKMPLSFEDIRRIKPYVERIASLEIWGEEDLPIEEIIAPQTLSVVDLAGLQQRAMEVVVDRTLRGIWEKAVTGQLPRPLFIFLEEAHNFVPGRGKPSRCADIINRIAAEGRKFKVFLVVITQRPYKINQDTLSQCGSQIIMKLTNPEDQKAVRTASENISESLLADLPGLNTGEAVILGGLTRVPVMIRVGERESAEGGADVDLIKELQLASQEKIQARIGLAEKDEQFKEMNFGV